MGLRSDPRQPGDLSITIMGIEALVSAKEAACSFPTSLWNGPVLSYTPVRAKKRVLFGTSPTVRMKPTRTEWGRSIGLAVNGRA